MGRPSAYSIVSDNGMRMERLRCSIPCWGYWHGIEIVSLALKWNPEEPAVGAAAPA